MAFIQDLNRSGKYFLLLIILFFALHNGGILEGKLFPVHTVADLTVAEDQDSNGWAEVSGKFEKLRECDYVDMQWFWTGENIKTRVPVLFPSSLVRNAGDWEFEGWQLQMPYDQVKDNSYVVVYHQCHPLWNTVTKFYP